MIFSIELVKTRKKRHLSATQLAELCGVSRSHITLIETGKRLPSPKVLIRMAKALNVKNSVILNWYLDDVRKRLEEQITENNSDLASSGKVK